MRSSPKMLGHGLVSGVFFLGVFLLTPVTGDLAPLQYTLVLRVPQEQRDLLHKIATEVSNPSSVLYGKHLNAVEVAKFSKPAQADVDAVLRWVEGAGATAKFAGQRVVDVYGTVEAAATLLTSKSRPRAVAAMFLDDAQTIPSGAVGARVPEPLTANSAKPHRAVSRSRALRRHHKHENMNPNAHRYRYGIHDPFVTPMPGGAAAVVKVTPAIIAARYNISGVSVRRNGPPTQPRRAVTAFDDEWFSQKELDTFLKAFVPSAQPGDDNITYVGDTPQDGAGGEAQLDIDYITGPAPGIRTEFWAGRTSSLATKNLLEVTNGLRRPP